MERKLLYHHLDSNDDWKWIIIHAPNVLVDGSLGKNMIFLFVCIVFVEFMKKEYVEKEERYWRIVMFMIVLLKIKILWMDMKLMYHHLDSNDDWKGMKILAQSM